MIMIFKSTDRETSNILYKSEKRASFQTRIQKIQEFKYERKFFIA